jgi:hypothetical protein
MKKAGRTLLLLAALAVLAIAGFARFQTQIYATVFARRLAAADLAPEDAATLAYRLLALDPGEARVETAGPRARLRYRIVNDFENAPAVVRGAPGEKELPDALKRAQARVAAMCGEVAEDAKTAEGRGAAADLLLRAKDPLVRRRAATALGYGGPEGLAALRWSLRNDEPVAGYAYAAARRIAPPEARADLLADALQVKALRARAIGDATSDGDRRAARVLAADLARADLNLLERAKDVEALEALTGEKHGDDAAAWKAWAEAHP